MKILLQIITLTLTLGLATIAGSGDIVAVTAWEPTEEVSQKILEKIYMKRKVLWKSGKRVVPINLPASNPTREAFTKQILKRGHRTLVEYWNGKHFNGIHPPLVLKSEEAVKRFLRKVPGSIGYIGADNIEADLHIVYTIKEQKMPDTPETPGTSETNDRQ